LASTWDYQSILSGDTLSLVLDWPFVALEKSQNHALTHFGKLMQLFSKNFGKLV
jgi:hypothetical protein